MLCDKSGCCLHSHKTKCNSKAREQQRVLYHVRLDIALVQAEIYNGATVIYFSAEGNTERVAKNCCTYRGLQIGGITARILEDFVLINGSAR